jgi:MFS family permease
VPAQPQRSLYYGWYIVAASAIGVALSQAPVAYLSLGVFMIPLQQSFGWDRGTVSLGLSVGALTLALSMPLVGRLVDRHGARRVLLPSMLMFSLVMMSLYFLTGSLWHYLGMFALIGVVGSGSNTMTYARVLSAWFDRRRGMALGFAMSGIGLGSALSPVIAQAIINAHGWRAAYLGLGLLVLAVGWPIQYFLMRDSPQAVGLRQDGEPASVRHPIELGDASLASVGMTRREAVRTKEFWMLMAIFFIVALTLHGLQIHLAPLLRDNGLSAGAAAGAAGLTGAVMFVSRIGVGYLLDKFFAPRLGFFVFLCPLVAMALVGHASTVGLALASATLLGVGSGAESDLMAYLVSRYFGIKCFAEIYGYTYGALMVGSAIGPYLWGLTFDLSHSYQPALWTALGGIGVICLLLLRFGRFPDWNQKLALSPG